MYRSKDGTNIPVPPGFLAPFPKKVSNKIGKISLS